MPTQAPFESNKRAAYDALARMPESVTLREISEELAIIAAIRRGEADAGLVVSYEEVRRRSAAWTTT